MVVSSIWTIEMQKVLTETTTVQTILNTLLSGIILLVSIVVSINSIVLSHDITSVETQEERIQGVIDYRQEVSELSESDENPSQPSTFLKVMSEAIRNRAADLRDDIDDLDSEPAESLEEFAEKIQNVAEQLGAVNDTTGAEFAVLWKGMVYDYGPYLEEARKLKSSPPSDSAELREDLEALVEAFELFAIGKEYFKTLYYTQEVSQLSRTLLVLALPAILFNATTILAIDAELLPDIWLLGLPPLQTFVAITFTVSLAPYLVLTAYVLRLSTVAQLTSATGIFSLN
jgi:hypothetical protein